jgi:hypothetical protein
LFLNRDFNADYESEITVSSIDSTNTIESGDLSEYKEYVQRSLTVEEQKALERELGTSLGIYNPEMCKVLAQMFRDYQLKDLQKFDKSRVAYSIPSGDVDFSVKEGQADAIAPLADDSYYEKPWPVLGGDDQGDWNLFRTPNQFL